jgi:hypothetical protein
MPSIYESNTKTTLPMPNEVRSAYRDGDEVAVILLIESIARIPVTESTVEPPDSSQTIPYL